MSITNKRLTEIQALVEAATHEFLPVNGHPDDDECTNRADGTDDTYCGEPEAAHDVIPDEFSLDLADLLAEIDRLRGECQRLANETKHPAWANITDGMVDRAAREIYRQFSGAYGDFCTPSVDQARAVVTAALVPLDRDAAVERMARVLADLDPGEPWPTNEELGGGPTGTRDDEYRHECMDRAHAALNALLQEDE